MTTAEKYNWRWFRSDNDWRPPPDTKKYVVCAARVFPSGALCIGARHGDQIMSMQQRFLCEPEDRHKQIEGFIDQHGYFLTRTEAWKIAEAAGQIRFRCGGDEAKGGTLYSENLY